MLSVACIRVVVVTILVYIPGHAVGRMYKGCSCNYFSLHSQDMLSVTCISWDVGLPPSQSCLSAYLFSLSIKPRAGTAACN